MATLFRATLPGMIIWLLVACSSEQAPVGRWEGFLESSDWIVAVRLQVDEGNLIRATALSVDVTGTSLAERDENVRTMRRAMPIQWQTATTGEVDFSNNILTRKGGTAPLFVYQPSNRSMTFNFFAHGKLTKRVRLDPVEEFTP